MLSPPVSASQKKPFHRDSRSFLFRPRVPPDPSDGTRPLLHPRSPPPPAATILQDPPGSLYTGCPAECNSQAASSALLPGKSRFLSTTGYSGFDAGYEQEAHFLPPGSSRSDLPGMRYTRTHGCIQSPRSAAHHSPCIPRQNTESREGHPPPPSGFCDDTRRRRSHTDLRSARSASHEAG